MRTRPRIFVRGLYENGQGVAQDQQRAIIYYRKAGDMGNQDAKDRLAKLGVQ